jgi:MFS family permease
LSIKEKLKQTIMPQINIHTLALTGTTVAVATSSLTPVTQKYIDQLVSGSNIALGGILSAASLVSSLVSIGGGFLADKYGRKLILILGIAFCCLGTVTYFKTETILELIAAVLFATVGTSIILSTMTAMTAESVADKRRASAFGYVETLRAVGNVLGPIVGGWILVAYGIRSPFLFAFAMYLLAFIGVLLLLKETHKGEQQTRIFPWKLSEIKQIHRSLPDSRSLYMLVIAQIVISFGGAIGGSLFVSYAYKVILAEPLDVSIIASLSTAISIIVMIPAATICDRIGRIPPLLVHEILFMTTQFGYAIAQVPTHLILVSIIGGIGAIGIPGFRALQTELMPKEHRVKLLSLYSFIASLAATPGPLISALVWDSIGPRIMFVISGFLVLPTAVVVYTSVKETLKKTSSIKPTALGTESR